MDFNHKKLLSQRYSSISRGIMFISTYCTVYYVFSPSWDQFGWFILADIGLSLLLNIFDPKLYRRWQPDSVLYFPYLNVERFADLTLENKNETIRSMLRYPNLRSQYAFMIVGLKFLLMGYFIFWVFPSDHSIWSQLAKAFFLVATINLYSYAAVLISSHEFISETIGDLHKRLNLNDCFRNLKLTSQASYLYRNENIAMGLLLLCIVGLSITLILDVKAPEEINLLFPAFLSLSICAAVMVFRIWTLSRRYLWNAFDRTYEFFSSYKLESFERLLPLHSAGEIARIESLFNEMADRLRTFDQELTQSVFAHAEKSRFETVGEIAGLIVHDMTSPLHVAKFCADQINEDPSLINDKRYLLRLSTACDRCYDLIQALRSYLKPPAKDHDGASFYEIFTYVKRIQFLRHNNPALSKILYVVDPSLNDLHFAVSRSVLIHVFLNLLDNAVTNLIDNNIQEPQIRLYLRNLTASEATIYVKDNGTGLTPERFKDYTERPLLPRVDQNSAKGLGLRLIRRLLERLGGHLDIVTSPWSDQGTTFSLVLPIINHHDFIGNQPTHDE